MKFLILIVVALASVTALHADDAAIIAAVKAADDARVAGMTAADSRKLDATLSDELHYAHSENLIETKVQHIESLTTRLSIYRKIDYKTREFGIVAPGVVLSTGRALMEVGSKRMIFLVDLNFLAVWRLEDQRWKLVGWQSCKNEPIVPLGPPSEGRPNQALV
jgi:hypothetical protein